MSPGGQTYWPLAWFASIFCKKYSNSTMTVRTSSSSNDRSVESKMQRTSRHKLSVAPLLRMYSLYRAKCATNLFVNLISSVHFSAAPELRSLLTSPFAFICIWHVILFSDIGKLSIVHLQNGRIRPFGLVTIPISHNVISLRLNGYELHSPAKKKGKTGGNISSLFSWQDEIRFCYNVLSSLPSLQGLTRLLRLHSTHQ
jgi:hypothetical protein